MPGPRDAILEAALAVFRENGYERTSVRAIAERADISISSLYAHIKGKQELFLELAAPVHEHARADMESRSSASDAPIRDKLRRAIVRGASAFDDTLRGARASTCATSSRCSSASTRRRGASSSRRGST